MDGKRKYVSALGAVLLVAACGGPGSDAETTDRESVRTPAAAVKGEEPTDPRCALPADSVTVREDGSAVLLVWTFPDEPVYSEFVLPADSAYLAYRAAIRADGADARNPIADEPTPQSEDEATIMRDESLNRDLAQRGEVGVIERMRCLDALLFTFQHVRFSQLAHPTEFVASVLRKEAGDGARLMVVFGAGDELFPPKSVYGFDVAADSAAQGWEYWYVLHNHTIQHNNDRLALGAPALSTSDAQLMRSLAGTAGLRSARVTNGFYTYTVPARELDRLRSR
jgi:hypothetical protein